MNFEEFKKRYAEKLVSTGFFASLEDALNDEQFNDRMAEIYLGLMVYSEFQNEEVKKQMKQAKQEIQEMKKKIIVPNQGIIQ